ncbi:MAG TPA: PLP-dependent aminotransferase family protein [Candidatus Hydrogenedentes bacterium]|nr:PLP-dependent aminotransferase family protein [Candidatus Hydrogenedentota bacterium]HOV75192.1 PLP-dependent aminotransferase family protein [Candidatus Hydrogenedentota bacterium]
MDLEEPLLSVYGEESAVPSPVNRMMTAFAADFREDKDINLGVGYVNERTIPGDRIQEAMAQVLSHPKRYRFALNYGGSQGSQNLIDALRAFYVRNRIAGLTEAVLDRNRILIGANGATSILNALADVIRPGIVVTTDPMYYIYCNALERKGFTVVTVPEDDEGMDVERLEALLASPDFPKEAISFFYVVTVNNPSCTVLSNRRRKALVKTVTRLSHELKRKAPLVLDGAYEFLVHDPSVETPQSALPYDELGIVCELGTLSKILAPALRIGYLIGADGPLFRALVQQTSDVGFSAPLINQEIASYLIEHDVLKQRDRVNAGYREKALRVAEAIEHRLGDAVEHRCGGQAGFYFYLTFKGTETTESSRFFHILSRTTGDPAIDGPPGDRHPRVVYIPGEHCVHPKGPMAETGRRQLRISYGFEETERIVQAIALMRKAL